MASSVLFSFLFFLWVPPLFFLLVPFHFYEGNPAAYTIKPWCPYVLTTQTTIRGLLITLLTDGATVSQLNMLGQVAYSEVYITNSQNVCRVMLQTMRNCTG